jgi:serine/threonine protein kinase
VFIYNMDSADLNQEWAFSEREIVISETIIGKGECLPLEFALASLSSLLRTFNPGAFGEVRVAKWRNIDVAAKRLHALVAEQDSEHYETLLLDNAATVDSFRSEMDTLAKLRHPNLVLFLGMGYNQRTRQPTTILTELLPESLYDIMETHKIKLNLPEIVDIALDVATGLDYLHSHNPQVVHRDISSKNILIGGNKAKIADLGQAKIFGASALSRQTSMPGAMAYSAPEVLTGKYTAKIDIFSFGILLIQMCCGEYPRIDRRERQQESAISMYPPLADIINQTISYQPSDRPTAAIVCEKLREVKVNDRFYPPLRRMPPQCDIGVMARRYIDSTIEERCGDVRVALEQTSRRLSVEEQRWRDEAGKVDGLERSVRDSARQVQELSEMMRKQLKEMEDLRRKLADAECTIESQEQNIQSLLQEKDSLNETLRESKKENEKVQEKLSEVKKELELSHTKLDTVAADCEKAKEEEFQTASQANNTKFQLDMQVDQCRELEMRLEQTLVRWKQEKEMVTLETERCSRLRATCSALVEKDLRNKEEVDRLTRRLQSYDSLPLPDEIKARFNDMEEDNKRLNAENEKLKTEKYENEVTIDEMSEKYKDTLSSLNALKEESDGQLADLRKNREDIAGLNELISTLTRQLEAKTAYASKMEEDKKNLLEITENIRDELQEAKAEVSAVRVARARNDIAKKKTAKKNHAGSPRDRTSPDGGSRSRKASVDTENTYSSDDENDYEDEDEDEDAFDSSNAVPLSSMTEESRMLILNDKEKLRRYSINTRLMKVRDGELGNAESGAFRDRNATRFHKFGGKNFGDLVHAATETQHNLDMLKQVQQEGRDQDESENLRQLDSVAKAKVQQALEHGGVVHIINCMWENLDVSAICRSAYLFNGGLVRMKISRGEVLE